MDSTPEQAPQEALPLDELLRNNSRALEVIERLLVAMGEREFTALQDEVGQQLWQQAQAMQFEALQELAQGPGRERGMPPELARVEIRFRALNDALGHLGRQAGGAPAALMPAPLLHPHGQLQLQSPLPARAVTLVLVSADGTEREVDVRGHGGRLLEIDDAQDVVAVQADDQNRTPLAYGVPYRVPSSRGPKSRRT